MPNPDDAQSQLLVALYNELNAIGAALSGLEEKTGDDDYDQGAVDDLVVQQAAVKARIEAIKAGDAFSFPSDDAIAALGAACDALAQIDMESAAAGAILAAAQNVVQAMPLGSTQA